MAIIERGNTLHLRRRVPTRYASVEPRGTVWISLHTDSEAVARSALERRESRGAHSRIDYPDYDEAWGMQNNIIVQETDEMKLKQVPITDMPDELLEILAEKRT